VRGVVNVALIGIVVLAIVASGVWHPGIGFDLLGTRIELQNLVRELVMVLVALASLRLTNPSLHAANGFEWEQEVAYLFAGIFVTIIPVIAMLQDGAKGPFSAVINWLSRTVGTPDNAVYFWARDCFHPGLCHRAARRRENAWLLPLYDLVGRNSPSHLRSRHVAIRDVDYEELVALSNR
jgi:Putative citrate transport